MGRHFGCKKYIWTNAYQREGSWTTTAELRNTREGLGKQVMPLFTTPFISHEKNHRVKGVANFERCKIWGSKVRKEIIAVLEDRNSFILTEWQNLRYTILHPFLLPQHNSSIVFTNCTWQIIETEHYLLLPAKHELFQYFPH